MHSPTSSLVKTTMPAGKSVRVKERKAVAAAAEV
jgi:hypothetical protein